MSRGEGHVELVTVAGTGIGKAAACLLAERGMHVALVGRRRELLGETARTIEAAGCRALVLPGDLGDPERAPSRSSARSARPTICSRPYDAPTVVQDPVVRRTFGCRWIDSSQARAEKRTTEKS